MYKILRKYCTLCTFKLNPTNFYGRWSVWTSSCMVIKWLIDMGTRHWTPPSWKLINWQMASRWQSQLWVNRRIAVVVRANRWKTALVFDNDILSFGFLLFEKVWPFDRRFTLVGTATGYFKAFYTVANGRRRIATANLLNNNRYIVIKKRKMKMNLVYIKVKNMLTEELLFFSNSVL